jgi:hypothetical protein
MFGESRAVKQTIKFDQNFSSCTWTFVQGSDNGKPIRRTAWNGNIQRRISLQVTDRRCTNPGWQRISAVTPFVLSLAGAGSNSRL